MDEQEKNPRLRWFKDLSPEAQVARRGHMDVLNAGDGSQFASGDLIPLAEAAARLERTQCNLLDELVAGKLHLTLYAPVLHEGRYAWPVTEQGIRFTSLLGNVDGVAPLFHTRLEYGEYAIVPLSHADIKKLKMEKSVQPQGYIYPERVLSHLAEWEAAQQEVQAASLADTMRDWATKVAWIPAFPLEAAGGMVKLEMLRVDSGDVPPLAEQPETVDNTGVTQGEPAHGSQISAMADATTLGQQQQYGEKRGKQIEAIEAGARALNLDPQKISVGKPKEEKKKIREWCKGTYPELFGGGNDPFDDAWDIAAKAGKILVINKNNFRAR